MIFSILVTGALNDTRAAFTSRFLVDAPSDEAAVEAVEREMDWSAAAHYKATSEGTAATPLAASFDLTPGMPRLIPA